MKSDQYESTKIISSFRTPLIFLMLNCLNLVFYVLSTATFLQTCKHWKARRIGPFRGWKQSWKLVVHLDKPLVPKF